MIYILVAFIQGYAICSPQNKIMRRKAVTLKIKVKTLHTKIIVK